MKTQALIAIFDIGKTNKKMVLLNQAYEVVDEKSACLAETADEDGFPCEDLAALSAWVLDSIRELLRRFPDDLKAVNFSAYGAALVLLNKVGRVISPLYNYLKPFPPGMAERLCRDYGGQDQFTAAMASPVMGNLNAGFQLYRLKTEKIALFKQLKYALHLPQYLSFLLTGKYYADITSIGCHSALWDYTKNDFHAWAASEGLLQKLAPLLPGDTVFERNFEGHRLSVGIGLHDSSAALVPYFLSCDEPFVLVSTGTWSVAMNPFNATPITSAELKAGCVCYLRKSGMPVKASRLCLGAAYQQQLRSLATGFGLSPEWFREMPFNPKATLPAAAAYHQLVEGLVAQQAAAIQLVIKDSPVRQLFVDGGFSRNTVYMHSLTAAFPGLSVSAATVPQASALGAALAIHGAWNAGDLPDQLIGLKNYSKLTPVN